MPVAGLVVALAIAVLFVGWVLCRAAAEGDGRPTRCPRWVLNADSPVFMRTSSEQEIAPILGLRERNPKAPERGHLGHGTS